MSWISKILGRSSQPSDQENGTVITDVPEDVFIEKEAPTVPERPNGEITISQDNIFLVYNFLSKDYHQEGYDDALINPDTSFRNDRIKEILGELDIVLRRSKTFYEDAMSELNFMIVSRTRLGLVDVVDELKMKKDKAEDHYNKILQIEQEVDQQREGHKLVISYNRGFQNGMAAIAIHEANKRKF